MAFLVAFKFRFLFIALLCLPFCFCVDESAQQGAGAGGFAGQTGLGGQGGIGGQTEADPEDIFARALTCFSDQYVYTSCQQSYRLNAEGCINVPPHAVDQYCGGPCVAETKLVLDCINNILYNFKFYNGASVEDVKYTLSSGCSTGSNRGNFNVQQRLGKGGEGDYYYGDTNKLHHSMYLLMLSPVLAALMLYRAMTDHYS